MDELKKIVTYQIDRKSDGNCPYHAVDQNAGIKAQFTGKYADFGGMRLPVVVGDGPGEAFRGIDILNAHKKYLLFTDELTRRAKLMSDDLNKATEIADSAVDRFSIAIARLDEVHSNFVNRGKKASGDVRDTAERLQQGLARIEKSANFERLEKYVELLERASVALNALAELERTGKLEKIAAAVR